ncbi:zinc finger protein 276 isoform X1 [Kryptolebias marmoratus]|uniref:zinc finger protein 276 isoform X1 n=1 Tax=Kryptolebias marmoratus TaxID=37003 RepID=UPI0007F921D2|nr:zinc finger protein 276 isoform X1 [Kryptolebias marmoratus]
MKKKIRRLRTSEGTRQTGRVQTAADASEEKMPFGNRGKLWKTVPPTPGSVCHDGSETEKAADSDFSVNRTDNPQKHPENKSKSSGRLSTAVCRLCHGKFSPRSLRHAFNKWPQNSLEMVDDSDSATRSSLLFHTDFQRLVGVQLNRDPQLSEFICKKCFTKFYKCHGILIRFLQRVNLPPVRKENLQSRKNAKCPESSTNHNSTTSSYFTSDPKCLQSLVTWTHRHGEACRSCPDLKEVLEGQCWGSMKAVWGCVDGHRYVMDAQCTSASYSDNAVNSSSGALRSGNGDGVMSEEEEREQEDEEDEEEEPSSNERTSVGSLSTLVQQTLSSDAVKIQNSAQDEWTGSSEVSPSFPDFPGQETMSPVPAPLQDRTADSDLSDRGISEDEFEENRGGGGGLLDEEEFEPYSDKRARRLNVVNKRRQSPKTPEEPRVRKKPGPKPGWKNKFKPKGEELPNIYKCPYQGCTAVYRAPDGLKKHIKEHHEDMRERPCPHPGCNKVFMIDRYLQRHVKLIHTEERNYICDQCGQTFKQRKHLSVHQMRHSGAKPLQCEVCGFQCRQRASLKYHMTKHKAEADLEFECLTCRKRFEKAHNLNVHMSMVHPLTQAEAQRGGGQQQQQYADLQTIGLTGEVVQQDQDR